MKTAKKALGGAISKIRTVLDMNYNNQQEKSTLKDNMLKLDKKKFKLFFCIFVHYWLKNRPFISPQGFLNLWCELNLICSEVDESFPSPYYDRELIKGYCIAHPFYFIDILELELVVKLFCEHCDGRVDILAQTINKLDTEGLRAAYAYSNEALGLSENVDNLVIEAESYIKFYS